MANSSTASDIDAIIILGGGTAARLGGVSKPDYLVGGKRLIDHLFEQLRLTGFAGQIVLVAPDDVSVPRSVRLTLEEPPHGGPLAGTGAGVGELVELPDESMVALATCDAPLSVSILPQLTEALDRDDSAGTDGAVPVDETGWPQYSFGVYRLGALRKLSFDRDGSIRSQFEKLSLSRVQTDTAALIDVDTPQDAALMEKMVRG